jgi:hypothetical protein
LLAVAYDDEADSNLPTHVRRTGVVLKDVLHDSLS